MEEKPLKIRRVLKRCPHHWKVSFPIELLSLPDDVLEKILIATPDEPWRSRRILLSRPSPRFALAASCTRLANVSREARLSKSEAVDMIYPRTLDDDEMTFTHLPTVFPLARFAHVYGPALKVFRVSPTVDHGIVDDLLRAIVDFSPVLETLAFRDNGELAMTLVDRIANLKRLTTLEVSYPSEAIFNALAKGFVNLENLLLHHVPLPHMSRLRSNFYKRASHESIILNHSLASLFVSVCMPLSTHTGKADTGTQVCTELSELACFFRLLHERHGLTHISIAFDYAPESQSIIETCFYNALDPFTAHFTLFHPFSLPPSAQRSIITKNSASLDTSLWAQYIYDFDRITKNAHDLLGNLSGDGVLRCSNTLMMNQFRSFITLKVLPRGLQTRCFDFLCHAMPKLSMLKIGQFTMDDNVLVFREWDTVSYSVGLALQNLSQITAIEIPWAFLASFKFDFTTSYMKSWRNIREVHLTSLYYAMGSILHHIPDACALTALANFIAAVSENCPQLKVINLQSSDCSTCNCIKTVTFSQMSIWESTLNALRRVYFVLDHIAKRYSHHVDLETVSAQLLEWENVIIFAKPSSYELQRLYLLLNEL